MFIDGTLGGGGHSEALLQRGATVFGVDQDLTALRAASARLSRFGKAFTALHGNFSQVRELLRPFRLHEVDGLILDLGVSSPQFDEPARGFSFQQEGPLDMRMANEGLTAAELIEQTDEVQLADWIFEYGEETFSRSIAKALKRERPSTTLAAVRTISSAVPRKAWPKKVHVATKTFQALRIAVNRELEVLDQVLAEIPKLLKVGGIAAIISFHSLEDRRVKQTFRELEGTCTCPPGLPLCVCGSKNAFRLLTKKAIVAREAEVIENPRARSARLRAVERLQ